LPPIDLGSLLKDLGDLSVKDLYELESEIGNQLGRKSPRKKPKVRKTVSGKAQGAVSRKIAASTEKFPIATIQFVIPYNDIEDCVIDADSIGPGNLIDWVDLLSDAVQPGSNPASKAMMYHAYCGHSMPRRNCRCSRGFPEYFRGTVIGHTALKDIFGDDVLLVRLMVPGRSGPVWVPERQVCSREAFIGMIEKSIELTKQAMEQFEDPLKKLTDLYATLLPKEE